MKATITGIGVVGGFGCGVSALEKAAAEGTAGPPKMISIRTSEGRSDVSGFLADTTPLTDFVPRKALRRIDHFTRLALLGSYLALEDAGLDENRRGRMGIVFATGYGSTCNSYNFLNPTIDDDNPCASPTRFVNSVHSAAAAHIATLLGENGPTLSINQYDMSATLAFQTACHWLEEGRVDSVLVGGADEFSRAMGFYTQHVLPGLETGAPLEAPSMRIPIGEGSAFFVLEKDSTGPSAYARVKYAGVQALSDNPIAGPPDTLMIINSDGGPAILLEQSAEYVSYAHLCGSLPVGSAFDIAMAAIMLKAGRCFPPGPTTDGNQPHTPTISCAPQEMAPQKIGCLKLGLAGDIGLVVLTCGGRHED